MRTDRRRDSILEAALEPGRRPGARPAPGPSAAGTRAADGSRQVSRSRLPLPPVPGGPRTTAAPFRAVPSPEIPAPAAGPDSFAPVGKPAGAVGDRRRIAASAASVVKRQERSRLADDTASAGPALASRAAAPSPRVPRETTPSGAPSPAYGDWTKPSRSDLAELAAADEVGLLSSSLGSSRLGPAPAPATTMIPERSAAARRFAEDELAEDDLADADADLAGDDPAHDDLAHDEYVDDEYVDDDYAADLDDAPVSTPPVAARGPVSGPVTGGRAARRSQLQAAEAARREDAKRKGIPIVEALADERPSRRPHRVTMGLVAMVVVALGVLGIYQVTSPNTSDAAAAKSDTATGPVVPETPALPTLPSVPVLEEPAPAVVPDAKAPVTVLNATQTTGLAAKIAAGIKAKGWETPAVGPYTAKDVAASTVFFTEGDETQRQAALNLIKQFPQLTGPSPRFFEVPADVAAPGLVVVTTGDWQP
ncbi:MAG: hypothetical protein JWQ99_1188 [Blastococcus sp.]|nr:hypothetical protein [Blastococcus sp.]